MQEGNRLKTRANHHGHGESAQKLRFRIRVPAAFSAGAS
jgi:hypothetical protein